MFAKRINLKWKLNLLKRNKAKKYALFCLLSFEAKNLKRKEEKKYFYFFPPRNDTHAEGICFALFCCKVKTIFEAKPRRTHTHRGPTPLPSSMRGKSGRNHLNEVITSLLPSGIQPNHIKFRTCSALAPMWTPPINESAELTQGAL